MIIVKRNTPDWLRYLDHKEVVKSYNGTIVKSGGNVGFSGLVILNQPYTSTMITQRPRSFCLTLKAAELKNVDIRVKRNKAAWERRCDVDHRKDGAGITRARTASWRLISEFSPRPRRPSAWQRRCASR